MDVVLKPHHHDDDDTEGVLVAKGVSMVVLFIASMICGLAPFVLTKKFKWMTDDAGNLKNKNRTIMSLLSFGGGVLLATTFLHLMPEVDHNIDHLVMDGLMNSFEFSLSALLLCCGFFMMYLVEELVHLYIDYRERSTGGAVPMARNLSIRRSRGNGDANVTDSTSDPDSMKKSKDIETVGHGHSHHHHSHIPVAGDDDDVTHALRGLLIVLALSIHELFEGLAVGLEASTSKVWYMLGAISAHKLVIAFCIGVELIASGTKTWLSIVYITTFSIVSSLGIGIGMLLVGGEGAAAAGVYSVVLQGLAAGTLLYVIFFEIWKTDRSGIIQYCAALVGFCLMFGLNLLMPHSHSHTHSFVITDNAIDGDQQNS